MTHPEKILIVGAGTMGEGIAQSFAQNGFDVRLVDNDDAQITRALGQLRQNIQQFIEFGLIAESVEQVMGRIEGMVTTDMVEAVEGCAYVIEAIPELLDPKKDLLGRLQAANPELIIGSNTGSFTMDTLAEGLPRPDNLIGIHYFNPAHIIPLVEIHRGSDCSDATFAETRRLLEASGKKTVLVREESARLHRQPPHGGARARDRLPPRRRDRDSRGPGRRRQVEHRLPVRLPGPHGGRGHDRPRHRGDGVGPRLQGPLQCDRTVADAAGEGREGRARGSSPARAGTTTAARPARKSSRRRTAGCLRQLKLFIEAQQD